MGCNEVDWIELVQDKDGGVLLLSFEILVGSSVRTAGAMALYFEKEVEKIRFVRKTYPVASAIYCFRDPSVLVDAEGYLVALLGTRGSFDPFCLVMGRYSSPMDSLVLTDSSQLTADGF
uniref:Uncharacterized protein n=1 Tax=Timema genevievae TaxID=629358 RepID=A0A7R9K343_TIMGE|nr:unnamed protein product [Timema genevievae]